MKIKNLTLKALCAMALSFGLASCSNDDETTTNYYDDISNISGAYVLNCGQWGSNNATLSFYNADSSVIYTDVFENQNSGANLGDLGQDMIAYGSKMYIAMSGSGLIYVTNRNGKLLNTISVDEAGNTFNPRALASADGYVFVSFYGGYVARIDTTNTSVIESKVAVGAYPEGVCVQSGKVFVANSGGGNYPNYDSTLTVVDVAKFKVDTTLNVVINPTKVVADGSGRVFVISMGNYGTVKNTMQRVNSDYSVDVITNATLMATDLNRSKLYYVYAQYGSSSIDYKVYNLASDNIESDSFVSSSVASSFANSTSPYCLSVNPKDGHVYVSTASYTAEGNIYRINPSTGGLISSSKSGGIYPQTIRFVVR